MAKTPTWQRAAGKSESGGLNEAGRRSLRAAGHDIKRPQPEGGARKDSFCARMEGMKRENTSAETANDPDSRINKSLRKWKCADGGAVDPYDSVQQAAKGGPIWDKPRPKKLGKPEPLSYKEKASAKASAKAAGRPYPNLVDNMRAARADGGELIDPYDAVQNAANTDGKPLYGGDLEQNQKISGISPAPNDYLYSAKPSSQPIENAQHLEIGNLQRQITPSFAENVISKSHEQAAEIATNSPNIVASDQMITPQLMELELSKSGRREPLDVNQNIATSSAYGTSTVTDPEGRTGHPVFVAGTTPTGQNVPLNSGQQAVMAAHLARIYKYNNPTDPQLAVTNLFRRSQGELTPEGKSSLSIGINTGHKETPQSIPHEVGHVVANYQNRFDNPLEGASPEALAQFRNMGRLRQQVYYKNRPDLKEYVNLPQEQWAEGFRGYITDPKMFKQTYPDAARFMRGIINTDPRINKLLNLSRNDQMPLAQTAKNGGQVEGDVQFADDDPYAKVQEAAKLPMMAQNDFAMHMPQPEVRYDTGPQPGEATLKAYDPTIKERIYQGIAGTEERPSPERAQFARGMSQMAEFAPVLGNVMVGQEAQRRGDTKGMLMAALPVPGMATEARMAEAAISPAQEAAREAYQRVLNAQGLYSHAAEAAANLPQAKGSYEQMMAMLQKAGVKPEEMRWSGVEQFAGQPVTREQLVSHFEQNVPKIEETYLSDVGRPHQFGTPEEQEAALNRYHSAKDKFWKAQYGSPEYDELANEFKSAESALKDIVPGWGRAEGKTTEPTKFSQYTIPGGENYREVLLHTPSQKQDLYKQISQARENRIAAVKEHGSVLKYDDPALEQERLQKIREATKRENDLRDKLENITPEYTSSHWDQPNVLGHLRMSDRTGPEGEKILHLEELQSDWGQQGRDKGFLKSEDQRAYDDFMKRYKDVESESGRLMKLAGERLGTSNPQYRDAIKVVPELEPIANLQGQMYREMPAKPTGLPTAPYVESTKNWTDLGLKRALKEAAEGGYSKMVWTPGEEQAARYDLSKKVGRVAYNPNNGVLNVYDLKFKPIMTNMIPPEKIADYIGKDAAEKLLATEPNNIGFHQLQGEGLSLGGQGMKGFYDKIVPTRLKELLKKIDPQAKIELGGHEIGSGKYQVVAPNGKVIADYPHIQSANAIAKNIPGSKVIQEPGKKMHSIEITPKIREAVKRGLPAYAHGGEVVNKDDPYDNIRLKAKNFPRARRASH